MASRYDVRTPITLLDNEYSFKGDQNELILDSIEKDLIFKENDIEYYNLYGNLRKYMSNKFGVVAGSFDVIGYNWEYTEVDDMIILTKYIGTSASVLVPAMTNYKPIKILNTAFTSSPNKMGIVSITFQPGCIVDTMDGMFNGLVSLKTINDIPASQSYVNTFRNTALEYMTIPDGALDTSYAFYDCKSLRQVAVPNSVVNMNSMHRGCTNLVSQSISNSVQDLDSAYRDCTQLSSFESIPWSVRTMVNTYRGCTNIEGLMMVESDDVESMIGCFDETPDSKVKTIHTSAVSKSRNAAKEIDGKNGVNVIYSSNYWNEDDWDYELSEDICILTKYLGDKKDVIIPSVAAGKPVYVSGANMFANNQNLETVKFEDDTIKYYGNTIRYMYRNCEKLTVVPKLHNGLADMSYAYFGCKSLQHIPEVPNSISNMQFAYAYSKINAAPSIPTSVDSLYFTFAGTQISSFPTITNNIKNIAYAFAEAKNIGGNIIIEAEDIPVAAMRNCFLNTPNEKTVYLPYVDSEDNYFNTIASAYHTTFGIADRDNTTVFYSSGAWDSSEWDYRENENGITLRKYIGSDTDVVVPGCINNRKVYSNGGLFNNNQTVETVRYELGSYITNMTEEFFSCSSLKEVENIPRYVVNATNAFAECRQLSYIPELPEGIENITGICRNCVSVPSIPNIPSSVTHMSYAFYGTENTAGDVYILSNQISNVQIYRAFSGDATHDKAVHVPAIGMNATHNTAAAAFNTVYGIDGKSRITVLTDL